MVGKTRLFTNDCTKPLKSRAYLYTTKLKNMPSRGTIVGRSMKKRFIHLGLMV